MVVYTVGAQRIWILCELIGDWRLTTDNVRSVTT